MEGRFTSPVRHPDDLARRIYGFCPDTVTQGTGTVSRLARLLRRERRLYLWWD